MDFEDWLEKNLPKHERLTDSVVAIMKSLLDVNGVEYLSITGRTKSEASIREKIRRKSYRKPDRQMTDISGIRVVLFIESDVHRVQEIVANSFAVDSKNSSNVDDVLGADKVGYRSLHFVCELGPDRIVLPEFRSYQGLRIEFQIRTVLQHAWAELAHDRSYKFRDGLPTDIRRKLNLYAGLLEIADRGFSEIADEIDVYSRKVTESYEDGNLEVGVDSISLRKFVDAWTEKNSVRLEDSWSDASLSELIAELRGFGVSTIKELRDIVPDKYAETYNQFGIRNSILGLVRDWMLIEDAGKLFDEVGVRWAVSETPDDLDLLKTLASPENYERILEHDRSL